jgi:hypothetical protein
VLVTLKVPWRDGTRALLFESLEFLGRRAALTPRPEINLLLSHGVLAPHARWRRQVVAYRRAPPGEGGGGPAEAEPGSATARGARPRRHGTWAALLRRAFALDVLVCPHCGGPLRVIGTVEDPRAVRQILVHRALAGAAPTSGPDPPGSSPNSTL